MFLRFTQSDVPIKQRLEPLTFASRQIGGASRGVSKFELETRYSKISNLLEFGFCRRKAIRNINSE